MLTVRTPARDFGGPRDHRSVVPLGVGDPDANMQTLAEIALKNECSRFKWQTDTPNTDAQRFYEDLGISVEASKLSYRAQGEALHRLADGS
jgi:acetyltransferase (GNAT) family protein